MTEDAVTLLRTPTKVSYTVWAGTMTADFLAALRAELPALERKSKK